MSKNILQKRIMRRVYYSFVVRTIMNPALLHGFFMLGTLIVLTYFVSIGNVIQNMLNIRISDLDTFVYNAFTHTEAWTLIVIGVFVFSALSLRFNISHSHIGKIVGFAR